MIKWLGPKGLKLHGLRRNTLRISSALPETVLSITIATAVVGTAATVLVKRTQQSEKRCVHFHFYFPPYTGKSAQYSNLLRNRLNQKLNLMVDAPWYVIYSNTPPYTRAFWARSVDAAQALSGWDLSPWPLVTLALIPYQETNSTKS